MSIINFIVMSQYLIREIHTLLTSLNIIINLPLKKNQMLKFLFAPLAELAFF